MFSPAFMGMIFAAGVAHAEGGEKLIRYDSYPSPNDDGATELFGGFFEGIEGSGKYNCMATVFTPEEDDYPVMPTELRVLLGGSSDEMLTTIRFYWFERDADEFAMSGAPPVTLLDQEEVLFDETLETGTFYELNLAENAFNFDGDHEVEGIQPITSGSIIASICYENEQSYPTIAMDLDGWKAEPEPDPDEVPLEGHETSRFRHMIYWNGLWVTLDDWLLNAFGFADGGDLIMRLVVETDFSFDTGIVAREPIGIDRVIPEEQEEGSSVDILVNGWGFDAGSVASIGEWELTGVSVGTTGDSAGEFLNGRSHPDMKPGVYDVIITNAEGAMVALDSAFTVHEPTKGCGCSAAGGLAAAWWVPLLGLGLGWRRRQQG